MAASQARPVSILNFNNYINVNTTGASVGKESEPAKELDLLRKDIEVGIILRVALSVPFRIWIALDSNLNLDAKFKRHQKLV